MDRQMFVDRLLETENLTDNLEDAEADHLLNWGIAQIDTLVADLEDEDAAWEKIDVLMKIMRSINRIVGNSASVEPKALEELLGHFASTFGAARLVDMPEYNATASKLTTMEKLDAVKFLLEWSRAQ